MTRLIGALVAATFLAGCGKSSTPASSTPTEVSQPTSGVVSAAQPESGPETAAPASDADFAAALEMLTQALRKYSFEHQRLPGTFSEVVAAGYVKDMPQAPAGKKFEVDPRTVRVILVHK